jgi:hypothetical protein
VAVEGGKAVLALPNAIHRDRCQAVRADVEAALATHFGRPVPLRLVVESEQVAAVPGTDDADDDVAEVGEAAPVDDVAPVASPEDRLMRAFPGAEEV